MSCLELNAELAHVILCILTIGIVGFVLDRLMSEVEARFKTT